MSRLQMSQKGVHISHLDEHAYERRNSKTVAGFFQTTDLEWIKGTPVVATRGVVREAKSELANISPCNGCSSGECQVSLYVAVPAARM